MIDKLKKLFSKKQQHEDLTQRIILGDTQKDGQSDYYWTARRINDITQQMRKLENEITFTLRKPIKYAHFTGYWAELNFNMKTEKTCEVLLNMSLFMINWLDKHDMIKPDTRTFEETVGRNYTRDVIFNEPQNIYTILEIIKVASIEMAIDEMKDKAIQRKLQNILRNDV